MNSRGFSLAEALIAMAIGSLLLMGACRFLPALQRHILRQGEQLALEKRAVAARACRGKTSPARRVLPGSVRRSRAGASR